MQLIIELNRIGRIVREIERALSDGFSIHKDVSGSGCTGALSPKEKRH
ncbi:hypothetical protein [Methylocystis rosea]|nr:hypothetical protein [Methylocystis rosea]